VQVLKTPPGLKKASELGTRPLRLLVYGEPGVGKTTFVGTAPKPLLVIDFEAGADLRLMGMEEVDILSVYSYRELKEALPWIKSQTNYKTIAFDGFSVFVSQLMREILEERGKASPTYYEWGLLVQRTREIILSLLKPSAHTIFTALEKKKEEGDKLVWIGPDLPKKIRETLRAIVDLEGRLWAEGDKRFIGFISPKGVAEVKDRTGKLTAKEEPDFRAILKKIYEPLPAKVENPQEVGR